MIRRLIICSVLALLSLAVHAKDIELNPEHPESYVVKKGDTLWDISGVFLRYPWHWPEIWTVNPQVKNPHLIYPGDVLSLVYVNGEPRLRLTQGKRDVKLSPEVREIILDKPVPTIPLSAIGAFLTKPLVVGEEVLETAPYVVALTDERIISGAGDRVYAKGNIEESTKYSVFKPGKKYIDPQSQELLGYEAIYSGDATVTAIGDPSTMKLTYSNREVMVGDRLLEQSDEAFLLSFMPHSPDTNVQGTIISVHDGVSQVGQYQIVVLNLGLRDGLEPGHVLSVYRAGKTLKDRVASEKDATVTLPDEHAGEALIFKLFDKVSYALVMKATHAIHVYDKVESAK